MTNSGHIDDLISQISEDKVHGAEYLSIKALEALRQIAIEAPSDTPEDLWNLLLDSAFRIAESKSIMAPITNRIANLFYNLPISSNLIGLREVVSEKAFRLIERAFEQKRSTIQNAITLLRKYDTVFTLSYSSTVKEVLSLSPKIEVIIAESRPLYEGQALAKELADKGIKTILIVDAAMASFIEKAESSVTGADSILPDGSVVNKVGTKLLALAAKDKGIPFYVIASTSKFNLREKFCEKISLMENKSSEIADIKGVEIHNPVFEVTPGYLVTRIVTEKGVLKPSEISTHMKPLERYVEAFLVDKMRARRG